MKHFNVTFKPDGKQISIHAGATLLEAAGLAGIILNTVCGGRGTCKKCAVKLGLKKKQVLACQYYIHSDITVTIPSTSRFFEQKILSHGIDIQTKVQPDIYEKYQKHDRRTGIFGLAVDIGTTTIVVKLIDMKDGQCLATQAAVNPQTEHGDDVISRINYAKTDKKLAHLQKIIIDCLNELTARLCHQASIKTDYIYEMCIVGNTAMNHIFLKLPITQLGMAPYKAFSVDAKDSPPEQLSLRINHLGNIHTAAGIAGFVGSDITAVGLAVDINSAEEMTLVVDIGTNGELILGTADKLYAASCAAGPALEGARISCGSRATEGAIEAVVINEGDIGLDVIGSCPPRSICGSGLIDAVAILLDLGIIDTTGRFVEPLKLRNHLPAAIFSRIIEQDSQLAFCLHRTANVNESKVILTQRDIREVQLAKGAIRTGIKLLQKKFGLEDSDLKHILLAGAFGNYIRRKNAVRIGLLPDIPHERIIFVGNAAASGAQIILLNSQARTQAEKLARRIEYIEIAHEPEFQAVFADSMLF